MLVDAHQTISEQAQIIQVRACAARAVRGAHGGAQALEREVARLTALLKKNKIGRSLCHAAPRRAVLDGDTPRHPRCAADPCLQLVLESVALYATHAPRQRARGTDGRWGARAATGELDIESELDDRPRGASREQGP